jgi:predicted nucleotide-binding protein
MKLKLEPVVLREQAEGGRALPHKLDEEMSDVEYAFVLLTPDDIGTHGSEKDKLRPRARQNVVYEHGLFVGRLGLPRICAIRMGDVELPSDLSGMIPKLINTDEPLDRLYLELVKELRSAGYELNANDLFS